MFARRTAQGILQHITGYQAIFADPGVVYVALFTTAPSDDTGAGSAEVTGGSYARSATTAGTVGGTWGAASNADPAVITNSGLAIAFPTATANWGTVVAFGVYDALTAGNLLLWDWLGNFPWLPCTVSAASPAVFTSHAHGFSSGSSVVFTNVFGGTAPTLAGGSGALGSNNVSLVTATGLAADTFELTTSATNVNTTTTGSGNVRQIVQQSVPSGVQPNFALGALTVSAA